ncbi:sodium:calcium antiporter [Acidipropionibacterium jensenii]|uniref:Sodium:calcium antiporter n=1 Tax=Acidipropionibacterium jensenii TaxID=1749 RepID=A0A3Q9UJF4_9ACTN|nr:calcium/sodium antiporter [Acidipropionibacterium jensenii]AZZ38553.1 sodium:calcium antiporter [Acidipropionibacterium jensenii]
MASAIQLVVGLAALVGGAELVVRNGAALAARLGVPPMVIGLTIVSIGTSAPELAVGIDAMRANAGSLAIGNIAGTNVVNLLLILGLCALLRPVHFDRRTLLLDLPSVVIVAVLVLGLTAGGQLATWTGIPLVTLAVVYTVALGLWSKRSRDPRPVEEIEELIDGVGGHGAGRRTWLYLVLLVVGIAVIVVGADWLVGAAESLARAMGVSDAFIGLTVIAIGTSTPELFTAIISTFRGERDIAIGNLIGSSTYNLTLILGVPVLVSGGSGPIDPSLLRIDLPLMVAVCLLCIPLFLTGRRLSKLEGGVMVACYLAYFTALVVTQG